jgi:uncharacterized protein (DUF1778 family)
MKAPKIPATLSSPGPKRKAYRPHELSERIVLSPRDTELVLHLLENPPAPTKAFVDAARRYKNR